MRASFLDVFLGCNIGAHDMAPAIISIALVFLCGFVAGYGVRAMISRRRRRLAKL